MRLEDGKLDGDLVLSEDLHLRGMVTGKVTVPPGRSLRLAGMVTGDLVVEVGGSAEVFGTVAGHVLARGSVTVHGVVGSAAGEGLQLAPGAVVRRR